MMLCRRLMERLSLFVLHVDIPIAAIISQNRNRSFRTRFHSNDSLLFVYKLEVTLHIILPLSMLKKDSDVVV
jgi:hypothetical protein